MSAGKGDTPRPVNGEKYRNNYDKIFKKESPEVIEAGTFSFQVSDFEGIDFSINDDLGRIIFNVKDLDKLNFK